LYGLAFKPAVVTSTPLRALTGARAKMGVKKMRLMQQHFPHVDASIRSKLLVANDNSTPPRELLLLQLLLQLHSADGLQLL